MTSIPFAHLRVALVDDHSRRYRRPDVLEIGVACVELERLDDAGALPAEVAAAVRVLLGAVGRLPACGMAEAFPPAPEPDESTPRPRLVKAQR